MFAINILGAASVTWPNSQILGFEHRKWPKMRKINKGLFRKQAALWREMNPQGWTHKHIRTDAGREFQFSRRLRYGAVCEGAQCPCLIRSTSKPPCKTGPFMYVCVCVFWQVKTCLDKGSAEMHREGKTISNSSIPSVSLLKRRPSCWSYLPALSCRWQRERDISEKWF